MRQKEIAARSQSLTCRPWIVDTPATSTPTHTHTHTHTRTGGRGRRKRHGGSCWTTLAMGLSPPPDRPDAIGRLLCPHRGRNSSLRRALPSRFCLTKHMIACVCLMMGLLAYLTVVPGAPGGPGGMLARHNPQTGPLFGILRLRGGRKKLNADGRNPAPAELRRIKKKRKKRLEKRAQERAEESAISATRWAFFPILKSPIRCHLFPHLHPNSILISLSLSLSLSLFFSLFIPSALYSPSPISITNTD